MMLSTKTLLAVALVALKSLSAVHAAGKPLKVFLLVGQSNMQGQAMEATLAGLAMDPETKPLYDKLVDGNGKTRVHENVSIVAFSRTDSWGKIGDSVEKHGPLTIGYGGNTTATDKLGPELAFGVTMYESLKEPILLIKTSWGGKSLKCDFRPPSAGPYGFAEEVKDRKTKTGEVVTAKEIIDKRKEATGKYYRLMLEHVRSVLADPGKYCPAYDPKNGYEIAGFAWFQGFNDLVGDYPPLDPGKGKQKDRDDKYSALRAKIAPLQEELDTLSEQKGKDRSRNRMEELKQKIQDTLFTPEEQDYMARNRSNQGYHYLGSAKTYSRIGEALAKSIVQMSGTKK